MHEDKGEDGVPDIPVHSIMYGMLRYGQTLILKRTNVPPRPELSTLGPLCMGPVFEPALSDTWT